MPADAGAEEFRTIGLVDLSDNSIDQTDSELPSAEETASVQDGRVEPAPDIHVVVPDKEPTVNNILNPSD